MAKYLLRRLVYWLLLVVIASSMTYLLASAGLNPKSYYQGRNPPPPPASVSAKLDEINANPDKPIIERYAHWVNGVLHMDFGKTVNGGEVSDEIGRKMWVSLRLVLIGSILGTLIGVAFGAWAAVRQYRLTDHFNAVTSFVILSTPIVVMAVVVKDIGTRINQAVGHKWFLTTGEITPGLDPWSWPGIGDRLSHLLLPTAVLTLIGYSFYSRYQRNAMLDVLGQDFVRTAQAKGLRRGRALTKHALRTALIPMGTFFAYQFGLLFVGATFTETIFNWNGMGKYLVASIRQNDINATAAVAMFVAVMVLFAGFLSDVITAALDPRIRRS
jgi:peptide/nickel transport system permease protein